MTVGCRGLRGWPSGFFKPVHESWNLWVFFSIGIKYVPSTDSFSEKRRGHILHMICKECGSLWNYWVGVYSVGKCTVMLEEMNMRRSKLCCSASFSIEGMVEKPAIWNKVHFSESCK